MARGLAISNGATVEYADGWQVAVGGTIQPVVSAFVADGGKARQFWPPLEDAVNKRILWSATSLTVRNQAQFNATSVASIKFTRSSGIYTYDNHPSGPVNGQFLSPALDGTPTENNKILIRVTQISGDVLTGILGAWIDMNISVLLEWSLDHSGIGSSNAVAEIDIAEDNGAGAPLSSTVVTKTVTFISEVTGDSGIRWSSVQRDLVEIKEVVDADCTLRFDTSGTATGEADTSGAFTEAWAGPGVDPADFLLNVSVVSGTYPSGVPIDTEMPLNIVRTIVLLATSGEDLSNELDVRVRDAVFNTSITKRVTMHSWRHVPNTETVMTSEPTWLLSETNNTVSNQAFIEVVADGTLRGKVSSAFPYAEEWHSESPAATDPENYEVMLVNETGKSIGIFGPATDVWLSLAISQVWTLTWDEPTYQVWEFMLRVRRVGQVSVNKVVKVFLGNLNAAGDPEFPPNDPEILP